MTVNNQALRYGQRMLLRRVTRAIPWVGTVVALATIGAAIRRKGLFRGSVDGALNALPYLGGAKIAAEAVRGRDFIRDRRET